MQADQGQGQAPQAQAQAPQGIGSLGPQPRETEEIGIESLRGNI